CTAWAQRAQAEQHQAQSQHPVDTEQSGMAMHGGSVQTLHVIQGDGRIDQKSKQSGAYEVPECHRNKEVDGPLISCNPDMLLPRSCQANVFPGFETDQHQRNHFKGAEHCAESEHDVGGSCEIQVMEGSDNSAGEK